MAEKSKISYEKIDDILYIGKEEKVKFSIDVALPSGDAVIDMGFDGLVKGIEIMNASEFFGISREELAKVKHGTFNVVYAPSYVSISLVISGVQKNNLIIPYSRKLALAA